MSSSPPSYSDVISKKKQTVSDFVRSNIDLGFQNLNLTSKLCEKQQEQEKQKAAAAVNKSEENDENNNEQQQQSEEELQKQQQIKQQQAKLQEQQQQFKENAFEKIYYIFVESDEVLPLLKERLGKAFFPNDSNASHNMVLTADAEWYQPKAVHFTDWTQTQISLLQIGLKPASSTLLNRVALPPHPFIPQQQQNNNNSASNSNNNNSNSEGNNTLDDDACIVLVFDIFAGKNLGANSESFRTFLTWMFNVTASQPRLAFDIRCDAKVLNALGIDLQLFPSNFTQPPRVDRILDLQLIEVAINGNPIRTSKDKPLAYLCMVPGMARTLEKFPTLSWFANLKKALKIRDNAQKMSADHFIRRPIDLETMVYTVADAGMLFHLFEEMLKMYNLHFANQMFVQSLLIGGDNYANLPRLGVEPKYDDNAFLPLGILARIDNHAKGDQTCCKCKRPVAKVMNNECAVCLWITQRWKERE